MQLRICRLFALLIFLFFSCGEEKETNRAISKEKLSEYVITSEGDTIPTGKPIPLVKTPVNLDSANRTTVVPLKKPPKVVPAHTNVFPAEEPEIVPIEWETFIPGENGIPKPRVVKADSIVKPALTTEPISALPPKRVKESLFDIYTLNTSEGLLTPSPTAMAKDSKGNIWITTNASGGLSRYDGQTFTHYTYQEGLKGFALTCLFIDKNDFIWMVNWSGDLIRFDGQNFTTFLSEEDLFHGQIWSIIQDKNGIIWIGSRANGAISFDGKRFTYYSTKEGLGYGLNYVSQVMEDSKGNIWFGSYGLTSFDGQKFTHLKIKEGVYSISEDRRGNLLMGTAQGLYKFNEKTLTKFKFSKSITANNAVINKIHEDKQQNIWLGSQKGIIKFDFKSYSLFTTKEGLGTNLIRDILEDSHGNIWIATDNGINIYQSNSFSHFNSKTGLPGNTGLQIIEDKQNNIWISTDGGISRFNGQSFHQFTINQGLRDDFTLSLLEDNKGNLWIGNNRGATQFDGKTFTHYRLGTEGLGFQVFRIVEDGQKNIWFLNGKDSKKVQVSSFDGKELSHLYTQKNRGFGRISILAADNSGNTWFGMSNSLVQNNGDSVVYYSLPKNLGIPSWLYTDNQNRMWIGGQESDIAKFDKKSYEIFTMPQGNSRGNNWISSISEDKEGNIWIGSLKNGVMILTPSSNSHLKDYKLRFLNQEDGLLSSVVNSLYNDSKNRMWIGTTSGVSYLDLNKFKFPSEPPKSVTIARIDINQQYIDYRKLADSSYREELPFNDDLSQAFDSVVDFYNYPTTITLPYDLNQLTFHFSAIDWAAPQKIQYRYKIEELGEEWSRFSPESKATYRNLSHDTYTLKVQAIGAAQEESEIFSYTFTILPPWWYTWWAYAIYAAITAALLFLLYRYLLNQQLERAESKRLKELDEVKTLLYTNITHEFRTPLTVVQGMAQKIQSSPQTWVEKGSDMILRNSRHLLRLVNQMLDLSKLESGKLSLNLIQADITPYLHYLVDSFDSYAETKGVGLHLLPKTHELVMDYDPERLMDITSNLLSNAIKFTPEGRNVYVSYFKENESLILEVRDTGAGISEEKLPYIFDRFYQVDSSGYTKGRRNRNWTCANQGIGSAHERKNYSRKHRRARQYIYRSSTNH